MAHLEATDDFDPSGNWKVLFTCPFLLFSCDKPFLGLSLFFLSNYRGILSTNSLSLFRNIVLSLDFMDEFL
jgi:hypothetical protein